MTKLPPLVMASVRLRKDIAMMRLKTQLINVVNELPVLRAHMGYISELIVHGIGPMPIDSRFYKY